MKTAPRFSVITCTWNSEPYIGQSIESVSQQTFSDIERVFVDGGSSDGTLERIQNLESNVVCMQNVQGGISHAMNVGVQIATGDYIAHLHGDDYYASDNVLETVARTLNQTGADWLFGNLLSNVNGRVLAPSWIMPPYSNKRLLKGNFIGHPTVFMRRSLFNHLGGFDTTLKYAMDYDMWLRAAKVTEPVFVEQALAVFRRHPASASTANAYQAFIEDHMVRRRHIGSSLRSRLFHEGVYLWRSAQRASTLSFK